MEEEKSTSFETHHSGSVNRTEFNYNGSKFATCGNDGKINIFSTKNILSSTNNIIPEIQLIKNGHNKPIFDISFSHPCYGTYLASCGNDKKLIIWKEKSCNNFENIFEYKHKSSVKCCKFAPYQERLILLCGTSDGSISIHELEKNFQKWNSKLLENVHPDGVNSVDWGPISPPINFEEENNNDDILLLMKFVSCGNDCKINIFESKQNTIDSFIKEDVIILNKDVPNDIAFLNFVGYVDLTFACGLESGDCKIYKYVDGKWENTFTIQNKSSVIKICWSACGTYLGISYKKENEMDNDSIKFFRENMDESWVEVN